MISRLRRRETAARFTTLSIAVATLATAATLPARAVDAKQLAYGKHLASECTSCHRIDGTDNGIPSIIGWDHREFVATMSFYKQGMRPNPAMRSVAESLEDDQVDALAAFFGSLAKPPKKTR